MYYGRWEIKMMIEATSLEALMVDEAVERVNEWK